MPLHRPAILLLAVLLPLMACAGAMAQPWSPFAPVTYRLDPGASYQNGCFPPCMCPLLINDDVKGTFSLRRLRTESPWIVYSVSDVNWFITGTGAGLRVTGSGEYRISIPQPGVERTQQLVLVLAIGDQPELRLDSGIVPVTGTFPEISLTVSRNGLVCLDTAFSFASRPVASEDVRRYALNESSFVEGCYDPCDCALRSDPLGGYFDAVKLPDKDGAVTAWAIINIRWVTDSPTSPFSVRISSISGFGYYTCDPDTSTRRLILDLRQGRSTAPERYDSGVVSSDALPCTDEIIGAAATNGFVCFNRVIDLRGIPIN